MNVEPWMRSEPDAQQAILDALAKGNGSSQAIPNGLVQPKQTAQDLVYIMKK